MSHRKPCRSDTTATTTPTRVKFARPRCFCGHVAAAIYPEPDPWSEPMPLTTNWVYECHYTPKQEGMVTPDHCYGCDEERTRALRARDVYDREVRVRMLYPAGWLYTMCTFSLVFIILITRWYSFRAKYYVCVHVN